MRRIIYNTYQENEPVIGTNSWKERVQADKIFIPLEVPMNSWRRRAAVATIACMPFVFANPPVNNRNNWDGIQDMPPTQVAPERLNQPKRLQYTYPFYFGLPPINNKNNWDGVTEMGLQDVAPDLLNRPKDRRYLYDFYFGVPLISAPAVDATDTDWVAPDRLNQPKNITYTYQTIFGNVYSAIPDATDARFIAPERLFDVKRLMHIYPFAMANTYASLPLGGASGMPDRLVYNPKIQYTINSIFSVPLTAVPFTPTADAINPLIPHKLPTRHSAAAYQPSSAWSGSTPNPIVVVGKKLLALLGVG